MMEFDPFFVEARRLWRRENLHGGTKAACSVACLEWVWRIMDPRAATKSYGSRCDCCVKPWLQKRLGRDGAAEESS